MTDLDRDAPPLPAVGIWKEAGCGRIVAGFTQDEADRAWYAHTASCPRCAEAVPHYVRAAQAWIAYMTKQAEK